MAVCAYCKTTVLKDAESVKNIGKMSEVLEDYSPLQIGSSGVFGGNAFTVIGRIQLRYTDGMWNEWYVMFDNGKPAWLGDASGQFMLTSEVPGGSHFPPFSTLVPGHPYSIGGQTYSASDVRTSECIGGQGELPFKVGQGYQVKAADLRSGRSFMTLDYSDSEQPKIYVGHAVTLDEMQCQLLREDEQIKQSAGKYHGKISTLSCPSCGSNAAFLPGLTSTIVCPSCHAQLDVSASTAQVLAVASSVAQIQTTLQLGAEATINGKSFQIIGLMRVADNESTQWTEYLMYSPKGGFLWLIETDEGWARAIVLDEWPIWSQEDGVLLNNILYQKLYRYPATVVFAIGAFNWRVRNGYRTEVVEFQSGQNKLAAEMTALEMTWSQSAPVSVDQIHAWFGNTVNAHKQNTEESLPQISTKFLWIIGLLNLIPMLLAPDSWIPIMLGMAAIYYPAKYLNSLDRGGA